MAGIVEDLAANSRLCNAVDYCFGRLHRYRIPGDRLQPGLTILYKLLELPLDGRDPIHLIQPSSRQYVVAFGDLIERSVNYEPLNSDQRVSRPPSRHQPRVERYVRRV